MSLAILALLLVSQLKLRYFRVGSPTRMISHTNSIPAFWKTLFRTNSPNPSRSAALAPPVLIIKLECFSLICAPPRVAPPAGARGIVIASDRKVKIVNLSAEKTLFIEATIHGIATGTQR